MTKLIDLTITLSCSDFPLVSEVKQDTLIQMGMTGLPAVSIVLKFTTRGEMAGFITELSQLIAHSTWLGTPSKN